MPDEEKEEIVVEDGKEKRNRKIEKLNAEIKKLNETIEKLKAESDSWKNEYYRAYADMQNLRKSLEKDHQNMVRYRAMGFVENLLPVLDSFHVVLSNEPEDETLKNYLVGFQFIYRNLVAALESEGVKELSPKVGDKFDASNMNAVEAQEVSDEEPEGVILKVVTKGYMLYDRLVRPSNVIVSVHKRKEPEKAEDKVEEKVEEKLDA